MSFSTATSRRLRRHRATSGEDQPAEYEIAYRELDAIDATTRKKAEPWAPAEAREQTAAEDRDRHSKWISPWEQRRPSGGLFPQPTGKRR